MANYPTIPPFSPTGPALRSGTHLNKVVTGLNNVLGNGTPQPGTFSTLTVNAGAGTGLAKAGGVLSTNVTAVGSNTSTTSQTLMSYSVPASTLGAAGNSVLVYAWGTYAGNADAKTLNLVMGGQRLSTGSSTFSGSAWNLSGRMVLTAANAEALSMNGIVGTTPLAPITSTDTSTSAGAITIAVTALTAGTASDVVQSGMTVTFQP